MKLLSFAGLASVAKPGSKLQPVLLAYGDLLVHKMGERGLQMNKDQLANAFDDVEDMIADPFKWGQRWLSEFRDDPNDNYMVLMFVNHCYKLFQAYMGGIEDTQPR